MERTEWRQKCAPDCACGKHRKRERSSCPTGCKCPRHEPRKKCEEGCTCDRHKRQKCPADCTCNRHKPSWNTYSPEQKAEARERALAQGREYARVRWATNAAVRERERERNRQHGWRYYLKSKFKLSIEQWHEMLLRQEGRCYLCNDPLNPFDTHIDHARSCCEGARSCGKCVRGLACRWCNQGLGQFRDDPARLRRAADALEAAMKQLAERA